MIPPGVDGWLPDLDVDAVLRGQGADAARARERNPRLFDGAARAARDGRSLLVPRVAGRVLSVRTRDAEGVTLEDGSRLTGPLVAVRLAGATEAAVFVLTLGEPLERRVSRMFGRDLPYAFALDAFGSSAVEALVRHAGRHLRERARGAGGRVTHPISPGMEGFGLLRGQREIFAILGTEAAGVTLLPSGGMTPRKSVSLVYGLGREAVESGGLCDPCPARRACRFRFPHVAPA
ncbi:MAG: hypothetical protein ACM3NW_11205 [Syntrophomonadaceae bacterium]